MNGRKTGFLNTSVGGSRCLPLILLPGRTRRRVPRGLARARPLA